MLDEKALKEKLPAILSQHVAKSTKHMYYNLVDLTLKAGPLGMVEIKPFEGKVVAYIDEAMLVKKNRDHFSVVDLTYVTEKPDIGKKVRVIPYSRCHFDGNRVDGYRVEKKGTLEITHIKYGDTTKIPVPVDDIKCSQLQEMIYQIENLPASNGIRNVVHILVDAKATNFSFNDPKPDEIIDSPPFLMCQVETDKFKGFVKILYDRGLDAYNIYLINNDKIVLAANYILFNEVGSVLEQLIDDRSWQKIQIQMIGR